MFGHPIETSLTSNESFLSIVVSILEISSGFCRLAVFQEGNNLVRSSIRTASELQTFFWIAILWFRERDRSGIQMRARLNRRANGRIRFVVAG